MPRAEERFLTASSRRFGRRMLSCSVFFSNSNLTGLRPERSYSLRSAVSTKRSASASVLKVGIFFFIAPNFLPVHVAGTDGANQALAAMLPDGEDQKTDRPRAVLPIARRRFSPSECASSGMTSRGRSKSASTSAGDTPCFRHFARLPSSQSNCDTATSIAYILYICIYKVKFKMGGRSGPCKG